VKFIELRFVGVRHARSFIRQQMNEHHPNRMIG
jgi:hypothetical protein